MLARHNNVSFSCEATLQSACSALDPARYVPIFFLPSVPTTREYQRKYQYFPRIDNRLVQSASINYIDGGGGYGSKQSCVATCAKVRPHPPAAGTWDSLRMHFMCWASHPALPWIDTGRGARGILVAVYCGQLVQKLASREIFNYGRWGVARKNDLRADIWVYRCRIDIRSKLVDRPSEYELSSEGSFITYSYYLFNFFVHFKRSNFVIIIIKAAELSRYTL